MIKSDFERDIKLDINLKKINPTLNPCPLSKYYPQTRNS